jgi:hypothetical protein
LDAAYFIPHDTDSSAVAKQATYTGPCLDVDKAVANAGGSWEQSLDLF